MSVVSSGTGSTDMSSSRSLTPSNKVIIFAVYFSLFLDNILLTVVVPIIPDYLYNLEHSGTSTTSCECDWMSSSPTTTTTTNVTAVQSDDTQCHCKLSNQSGYIPEDIINENSEVGLLFSSKAFVQLVANAFMGMIINRIGYSWPLFLGNMNLLMSSTVFAFSSSYNLLFLARSLQGIGSAFITVSGLGLIADRYPDDQTRSKVMGFTMGGIAMGVLVGYPFGGILYDFVGKTTPFLIIASLSLTNTVYQMCVLKLTCGSEKYLVGTPPCTILKDRQVLIIIGTIWISTSAMAVLEPCLPIWLMDTIMPQKWQLGAVFIPDSVGYLIGTTFFGVVAFRIGRWRVAMASMIVVGSAALLITSATQMSHLIVPHFFLGFGIGVIDSALMPLLAHVFDTSHSAEYGSIYAVAQAAVSLAYFVGPLLGSQVVKKIGFPRLMRAVGVLNIAYSPLCIFLRQITVHEENQIIILDSADGLKYKTENPQPKTQKSPSSSSSRYQRFGLGFDDSD